MMKNRLELEGRDMVYIWLYFFRLVGSTSVFSLYDHRLQHSIEGMWSSTGICSQAIEETIRMSPRHSPIAAIATAGRGKNPHHQPLHRGGRLAGGKGRHVLFTRGNDLAECLAFTMAVQEFKELCRHDLTTSDKVSAYRYCTQS